MLRLPPLFDIAGRDDTFTFWQPHPQAVLASLTVRAWSCDVSATVQETLSDGLGEWAIFQDVTPEPPVRGQGEDANGREVGAAAVGTGFAVVVVFRELVEEEEGRQVGEALQTLEAGLAEAFVDGDCAADGTPVIRVLDVRPVVPDRTYRCDLEARYGQLRGRSNS
ncbi:hypothetical protein [Streptomyces cupreus]|uniref:Uncharacterized protein n=1 Tax=Streptomyces cupreus TaxID=2759956 RepID=A0A7X1MAK8_9ACTN|nr:hypothetical protein [Streptomyces cupreus]MBC2904419.1 hypothetical protein [Streptomyces cupreus]